MNLLFFLLVSFTILTGCATSKNAGTEGQTASPSPIQYKDKSEYDELFEKEAKELLGKDWQATKCDFKVDYDGDGTCIHFQVVKKNQSLWIKCISSSDSSYPTIARGKCGKQTCKGLKEKEVCRVTDGPEEIFEKK